MRFKLLQMLDWLLMPKKLYILDAALDFVGLGTPDMPAAPDYTAAAEATAAGNLEMAGYTTDANRPDMTNPFGTSTWTNEVDENGNPINWANTVSLSPEQQALFDQQQSTDLYKGDLAFQGLQNTGGMFSDPYKTGLDPMSSYDDQRSGIIDNLMARVDTDVGRDREAKKSQLIAQGIPESSPAFDTEMERFDRRLTDANQQAELGATDIISKMLSDQRATRNQTMSEDLTERQTPLNELNALTGGTAVTNPSFQPFSQQQQILGPDYMGATTAQSQWDLAGWNAETAQNNAILGGLFDLGASAIQR